MMVKREIVVIDEDKCNGCGKCVPNCYEGALQIIDGKARLISELFCDGLGNCLGHCPQGAITLQKKEAEPYDEKKTMENIAKQGENTVKAHLSHLKDHGEEDLLAQAIEYLEENNMDIPKLNEEKKEFHGCPGSKVMDFEDCEEEGDSVKETGKRKSKLRQWPVQLHLVPPNAPYFKRKDVLISADCVAYSLADFHKNFLDGKSLAIACPKLDSQQEIYKDKIVSLIDDSKINSLTVMTMEVPCCSGLQRIVQQAMNEASSNIPLETVTINIKGEILN
jgi:ferredoxin